MIAENYVGLPIEWEKTRDVAMLLGVIDEDSTPVY